MFKPIALITLGCLTVCGWGATDDLAVAREALRDGFWALARTRANACLPHEEARSIVLESLAREGKWEEIEPTLKKWGEPAGDLFTYYRALALAKGGSPSGARVLLEHNFPKKAVYAHLATRLLAEMALSDGEAAKAADLLSKLSALGTDDRLLLAEARSRAGSSKEASALWREVLLDTNASVRAIVTAASNLGDAVTLRHALTNSLPADVRSLARLRLGTLLLPNADTFDEGAKLIRETVTASPDAAGAQDAFRALASAQLDRADYTGAVKSYSELFEIWPTAAREEPVQEGLGWALFKAGRSEEALAAFRRAEACAKTDDEHALAAVKVADALAALGRLDESTAKCREVVTNWPKATVSKRLAEVVRLRELEKRGRTLYRDFRFEEAQKAFAEVAAGDAARRGRMMFYEILCLYGQGRDSQAVEKGRSLAEKTEDPRLKAELTEWLARAAYNGDRWGEAVKLFGQYADSPLVKPEEAAAARVWAARAALSGNNFTNAIALAAKVVADPSAVRSRAEAQIVQGEALLELARFDEAVLVFDRAAHVEGVSAEQRLEAQMLRADALYAMGADNPSRYKEALEAYRALALTESVSDAARFTLAYKTGLVYEKLKRDAEAIDQYYAHVVLAYRDARKAGNPLDDATRAVFARAAFRLADLCEASGHSLQALKTLELVAASDVPAADEAVKRIERIQRKGILP